jgi:hypothetical protein
MILVFEEDGLALEVLSCMSRLSREPELIQMYS